MTIPQLALAIFVLLVTPGPTNTLIALAGAERGWAGALRLLPAELAGYLLAVIPLAIAGQGLLARLPEGRAALTLLAAAWVLWLAVAMWRAPPAAAGPLTVTAHRVAVTTLLNPKSLVFGLVLLPAAAWEDLARNLALFAALVVAAATMWAGLGARLRRGRAAMRPGLPRPWRRAAAIWLGLLSAYLVGRIALA